MLITELEGVGFAPEFPELVGKRVLLSGIEGPLGLELARAFAEARTRLVLHTTFEEREAEALREMAAGHALDLRVIASPAQDHEAMLALARSSMHCFGGLDAVINLAHVGELAADASTGDVERLIADTLARPCLVSRVAANRMRTMLVAGSIVNILSEPRGASGATRAVAALARSHLAGLTRVEAGALADSGIRLNAIAPTASCRAGARPVTGEPDVATLALHLASGRSHNLTGLVFEAYLG